MQGDGEASLAPDIKTERLAAVKIKKHLGNEKPQPLAAGAKSADQGKMESGGGASDAAVSFSAWRFWRSRSSFAEK
jgi:hypothetical protein